MVLWVPYHCSSIHRDMAGIHLQSSAWYCLTTYQVDRAPGVRYLSHSNGQLCTEYRWRHPMALLWRHPWCTRIPHRSYLRWKSANSHNGRGISRGLKVWLGCEWSLYRAKTAMKLTITSSLSLIPVTLTCPAAAQYFPESQGVHWSSLWSCSYGL